MPAAISTAPTMCMKVAALTGTTLVTSGLKYMVQSVSLLKYLSTPVMIGPRPRPMRSAHQLRLRRRSRLVIKCTHLQRAPRRRLVTAGGAVTFLRPDTLCIWGSDGGYRNTGKSPGLDGRGD